MIISPDSAAALVIATRRRRDRFHRQLGRIPS